MENHKIIKDFLMWLRAGHSPATVDSYRYALNSFQKWLAGEKRQIMGLSPADIGAYQYHLETQGLKGSTRFSYITALRALWRWLHDQGLAPWSWKLIPLPDPSDKSRMPALEVEDFYRIMSAFDEKFPVDLRDKTIISLFFATGLRLSELVSLDVASINMNERYLTVRTFKRRNHWRDLFWDDETHRLLELWLDIRRRALGRNDGVGSAALFISLHSQAFGKRLNKSAIQKRFRSVRESLGIDKRITAHSCRHGFGTRFGKKSGDVFALKELMGHANINHTHHYVHLQREDLRRAYNLVHAVGKQKGLTSPLPLDNLPAYAHTRKEREKSALVQKMEGIEGRHFLS